MLLARPRRRRRHVATTTFQLRILTRDIRSNHLILSIVPPFPPCGRGGAAAHPPTASGGRPFFSLLHNRHVNALRSHKSLIGRQRKGTIRRRRRSHRRLAKARLGPMRARVQREIFSVSCSNSKERMRQDVSLICERRRFVGSARVSYLCVHACAGGRTSVCVFLSTLQTDKWMKLFTR